MGSREQAALHLADRLHSASLHLLRRLRAQDGPAGLTPPASSALSVIVYAGPIPLTALARAEQVRPPTMSRLVRSLEEAGLVAREGDAADRRVQRFVATPRGRRVLEDARARRVRLLADALAGLSAEDRRTLETAVGLLEGIVGPAAPWQDRRPRRRGRSSATMDVRRT